jgi:hypothetical protein
MVSGIRHWNMGQIGCPETSITNQSTLRNIPEDRSPLLRRGGSLKSRKNITFCGEVTPVCPYVILCPGLNFYSDFHLIQCGIYFKKIRRKCDFVDVGRLRAILIQKALTSVYSYFPRFVTHFCQILCRRFPRNATELLWGERKSMQGEANFPYGLKGNFALISLRLYPSNCWTPWTYWTMIIVNIPLCKFVHIRLYTVSLRCA